MRAAVGIIFLCFYFLPCPSFGQNHHKKNALSEIARTENVTAKSDTVQALRNLFQRKRKSTRLKAGVIGILVDALLIRMWTHPHTLPQAGLATGGSKVEGGSSVPVSSYVAVSVATVAVVEIVVQQRYGQKKLRTLLDEYENGKPLPARIKSKLSPKDFD